MKLRTLSVAIATIAMGACTLQNKTAEPHEVCQGHKGIKKNVRSVPDKLYKECVTNKN